MALPSLYDLAFADDATAEEQARALAAALRGQRGGGMLGMATGDKYLAGLGQQMVQGANQQEAGLADMASTRLQRALERQRMAQQQAQHEQDFGLRRDQLGLQRDELAMRRDELAGRAQDRAAAADAAGREAAIKGADDLRKELQNQQSYKDYQTVNQSYQKIQSASPTGAGDISLVYGYMKLLDPGSTVREGEFATAANAGSAFDRVGLLYNKVLKGEKLPDSVRAQFKAEAGRVFGAQQAQLRPILDFYRTQASKRGIDPADVLSVDLGAPATAAAPGPAPVRRVLNGKTYEQGPDGWYEVD